MPERTIRSMVSDINYEGADAGGLWLPGIQRYFVWNNNQIESLFDSVMRRYPLPSILLWRVEKFKSPYRRFIDNAIDNINPASHIQASDDRTKRLVLDGQQRLQSFYIGLKGTFDGKKLCFKLNADFDRAYDEDIFKFKKNSDIKWPWVVFKELVSDKPINEIFNSICATNNNKPTTESEKSLCLNNIERAKSEFMTRAILGYQEIDFPADRLDDVLEIFTRFNSGGAKLSKSDLMFSSLMAADDQVETNLYNLLESINSTGYEFNRDFVIKTSSVVAEFGARYDINAINSDDFKNIFIDNFTQLGESIKYIRDFVFKNTVMKNDKSLPSYLSLIPVIYYHYHYVDPNLSLARDDILKYLNMSAIAGVFSGHSDALINNIVGCIEENGIFDFDKISEVVGKAGKSFVLEKEKLFSFSYERKSNVELIFSLWYGHEQNQMSAAANHSNIDHIFPKSLLKKNDTPAEKINQFANLMLLTAEENGPKGKSDKTPEEWFGNKKPDYLNKHCIPTNKRLWKLNKFDEFIAERKKLISLKLQSIIAA